MEERRYRELPGLVLWRDWKDVVEGDSSGDDGARTFVRYDTRRGSVKSQIEEHGHYFQN